MELGEFPRNNLPKKSLNTCWKIHWFSTSDFWFPWGYNVKNSKIVHLPSVLRFWLHIQSSSHPGPAFFAASLKLASLLGSNPWPFLLWFASGIRRSAAMSTLNPIEIYISLHFQKDECFSMSMSFMKPDSLDSPQIFSFIWFFLDTNGSLYSPLICCHLMMWCMNCYLRHWKLFSTHTGSLQTYHLHCSFQTLSNNEFTRRYGSLHLTNILQHNQYHIKDLDGNNKKHWFG